MNYAYNYKNKNSGGFMEEMNRIQEIKNIFFLIAFLFAEEKNNIKKMWKKDVLIWVLACLAFF